MTGPRAVAQVGISPSVGIVSTSDEQATQGAARMLGLGGTAFDAALCASMVLAVTRPMSCGIGGDGAFLLHHAYSQRSQSIHALGVIPQEVGPIRAFLPADPDASQLRRTGILTASVPALPWGWARLAKHCVLPLRQLAAPAIGLARDGFVPDALFRRWTRAHFKVVQDDAWLAALFRPLLDVGGFHGQDLRQEALADFLELFSETAKNNDSGWSTFFVAEAVKASRAHGGVFSPDDFGENMLCEETEPVGIRVGDYDVLSSGSTTQGYMGLLAARLLHDFDTDFDAGAPPPARALEFSAKVFHILYADRLAEFGDRGDHQSAWLMQKLDDASVERLAAEAARLRFPLASPTARTHTGDTTYFYAIDRWGNAASCIQSLSLAFGSGVAAPTLGLIFNSRLARGVSLLRGAPNSLAPWTRPINTIFPVLGLRRGSLAFVGGTPGGDLQVQLNARAILQLARHGSLRDWCHQPRWKYSPVSDSFDSSRDTTPTITVEACAGAGPHEWKNALKETGLRLDVRRNIDGAIRYAYVDGESFGVLEETQEGGSTQVVSLGPDMEKF